MRDGYNVSWQFGVLCNSDRWSDLIELSENNNLLSENRVICIFILPQVNALSCIVSELTTMTEKISLKPCSHYHGK